jgi:thiosulfate/3-mercaptopyruvate sulfurtransferase
MPERHMPERHMPDRRTPDRRARVPERHMPERHMPDRRTPDRRARVPERGTPEPGADDGLLIELERLEADGGPVLWVDTRRAPEYRRGHIPGAIHLDTFEYANERTDERGLARVEADWCEMFWRAGIRRDDRVVFYDEGTENRVGRPAFMLRYLGHERSHALHGGMKAWLDAGRPVERAPAEQRPNARGCLPCEGRREMIATADDVAAVVRSGGAVLLDVRDEPEYQGRRRLQWNPRMGRIPGTAHVAWTDLLQRTRDFPALAGTPYYREFLLTRFREPAELRRLLASRGLTPETDLILYCQKSHRACTAYAGLQRAGFRRLRVYVGSFREWSRRFEFPVERGPAGSAASERPRA